MSKLATRFLAGILIPLMVWHPLAALPLPSSVRSARCSIEVSASVTSNLFQREALSLIARFVRQGQTPSPSLFRNTRVPNGWRDALGDLLPQMPGYGPQGMSLESPGLKRAHEEIARRMYRAREAGLFSVITVSMELKTVDKSGKPMIRQGSGESGQALFATEQPIAMMKRGLAMFGAAPLFSDDVKANYGTLDAYLEAYDGFVVTTLDIEVGKGFIPIQFIYIEQEGRPIFQLYDPSGFFFRRLNEVPAPGSIGAYIEAILLGKGVVDFTRLFGTGEDLRFDVYHFNDWQTGFGPPSISYRGGVTDWHDGQVPASVFTPRNLDVQGVFPGEMRVADPALLERLLEWGVIGPDDVDIDLFTLAGLSKKVEFHREPTAEDPDRHSLLRLGITYANRVHVLSEASRREILDRDKGPKRVNGLWKLFSNKSAVVTGSSEGILVHRHRPQGQPALQKDGFVAAEKPFEEMTDQELLQWKRANVMALQKKMDLEVDPGHLTVTSVHQLVRRKGLKIWMEPFPDETGRLKPLLEHVLDYRYISQDGRTHKIQVIIAGLPKDYWGHQEAQWFESYMKRPEYAGQFKFKSEEGEEIEKQVDAGSLITGSFSIDDPGASRARIATQSLSFILGTNRGGHKDLKKSRATPLDLVDAFEALDIPEERTQRVKSAQQIFSQLKTRLNIYVDHPEQWERELRITAYYDASWDARADGYMQMYKLAFQQSHHDRTATDAPFAALIFVNFGQHSLTAKASAAAAGAFSWELPMLTAGSIFLIGLSLHVFFSPRFRSWLNQLIQDKKETAKLFLAAA
jgi:glycogen synthase